jgi:hypothetical protein
MQSSTMDVVNPVKSICVSCCSCILMSTCNVLEMTSEMPGVRSSTSSQIPLFQYMVQTFIDHLMFCDSFS